MIRADAFPLLERLINDTRNEESAAFYLKMKADYYRYLAEISTGDEQKHLLDEAKSIYENAENKCDSLFSTHPLRLATALNHSVHLAENFHDFSEAIDLAKSAFEAALFDLQALNDDQLHETLRVMQLLRDNYTLWEVD